MKIKINTQYFQKQINIVEKALDTKIQIEELKGISIIAKDGCISLTTSNNNFVVKLVIEKNDYNKNLFSIEADGEVVINGLVLSDIIKKIDDDFLTITFEKEVSNLCIVKTVKSKYELISFNDYPKVKFNSEINNIKIKKESLVMLYAKTKHAVLNDISRPVLTGINLSFMNNITAIATDTKRVSKFTIHNDGDLFDKKITLAKKSFSDIGKILNNIDDEFLDLSIFENQLNISGRNIKIKTRLIEGNYPNLEDLFKNESKFEIEIDSNVLFSALSRVDYISNKSSVNMEVNNNKIILTSFDPNIGRIEEVCDILIVRGNPFKISFLTKYLIEAINSINSSKIKISFSSEVEPFRVECVENKENEQLILPMRSV